MLPPGSSAHAELVDDATFRRLCRARDLAAAAYDRPLDVERLAREACLSPWHFHRLFTRVFGETPHDFLSARRIDAAKRLLASGACTVTEACLEVGYASPASFSTLFRRHVGLAPSEWRREIRRVFAGAAPARAVFIPVCFLAAFAGTE